MIESFRKNKLGITFMIVSSICVCIGQLFWKLSTLGSTMYLLLGFLLYGIGAVIMIVAYKFGSLSVLQPMLSLNYVITIILGKLVLGEIISVYKLLGVTIIIISVILIGGGES